EPPAYEDGAKLLLRDLPEPTDYTQMLVRLLESPNLCSREWVYRQYDPYVGTVCAVAEAARNLAASGAEPIGVTNCLNFGSPEKPEVMWQFQQSIAGLRDACLAFGTPVISGNVSFYNETEGRSIPPTPVIGMVGLL